MKRVVIVRHAKSVPYGYDDDFNRGLKDRGHNDAGIISDKLKEEDIKITNKIKLKFNFPQFISYSIELNVLEMSIGIYVTACYFFLQMGMSSVTMPIMRETSCIRLCHLIQGLAVK